MKQKAKAHGISAHVCAKLLQLCLTLCDPMDCSLPVSSAHGILQARILEWVVLLGWRMVENLKLGKGDRKA